MNQQFKNFAKWFSVALFATIFILSPAFSLAANTATSTANNSVPSGPSCFDYYKFQSITIDLLGNKKSFQAGEGAEFIGSIINANTYPVVDGSLILRLSKLNPKSSVGNDIIDEWTAKENINLRAGEKMPVSFNYQLPSGLPTGSYTLTSYFLTQNKFNLAGLSFTDDIYGGYTTFSVEGKSERSIKFDRAGVKVDGVPFRIFGLVSKYFPEDTKSISVEVPLENGTDKKLKTSVIYSIYGWDGAKENLLKTWSESVDLLAGTSKKFSIKPLSFKIDMVPERPVYFVRIKAESGDELAEIHIRLAKRGFRPRLNDLAITNFPISGGQKSVIFACYHNTTKGQGTGKLDLSLISPSGKVIAQTSYAGDIFGDIRVLTKEIVNQNLDKFTLSAKLYDNKNNLVDETEISYDCSKFAGSICLRRGFNIYYIVAGIILIMAALYLITKHFRKERKPL